jgi:hypothetical protein
VLRAASLIALAITAAIAAPVQAQRTGDPPCAADSPAAMRLTGLPAAAVAGRGYTVGLVPDPAAPASAVERHGSTLGVHDRGGRGWSAHYEFLAGVSQEFSVGLRRAPFTVTGSYAEQTATGTCTRTLTAPLPIIRRIYAVVDCRRRALEPRSGLVLGCRGARLALRGLRWSGWNADTTTGRGSLRGRAVIVTLSQPRECPTLDGFIYTRARVRGAGRFAIECPID